MLAPHACTHTTSENGCKVWKRHIASCLASKAARACRWAGSQGAPKLYSGSYDGSLRCLDPVTGNFEVVFSSEEAEFSAMDVTADANVAIMGDNDGYLHVFDIRENKAEQRGKDAELHNKRVNTLHVSLSAFLI